MKRVLIITDVFPPAFNPRMGYLVKHLSEFGWDADIVTTNTLKDNNYEFLVGNNKIIRVVLENSSTPHGILQKVWRTLNMKRHYTNNKKPFINGIDLNFKKGEYSIILVSVSWELYILEAGLVISRKWGVPFIVDLRDIIEQKPNLNPCCRGIISLIDNYLTRSFEKKKLKMRNRIIREAKVVTTVSPFHVAALSNINNDVRLIYNGYDQDLFNHRSFMETSIFYIIYTGIVINEMEQDPTILFEAVNQLETDKIIDRDHFRIQFFTPLNFRSAITSNRYYHFIKKYVDFFNYVDYREIPELLKRSSIALVLTNTPDNNGPKGVITTKLFDYLGAERPVLCVRSDEGALEDIINKANIGISARNADEAYNFILDKWKEWKEKGYTIAYVNQDYKQHFTRRSQAKQFVELFESIIF